MPAYAYPIRINRERQTVQYSRNIELGDPVLTLEILSKLITADESFCVTETDWGNITLSITGSRLETDEELAKRVEKEEKYMAEYNKRKSQK